MIFGALLIVVMALASLTAPSGNQVAQKQATPTPSAAMPGELTTALAKATDSVAEAPIASESASAVPTPARTPAPTAKPTARPTAKPTARPTVKPTIKPTAKPTAAPGPYGNPWGYDFRPGNLIYSPPSAFCSYFPCISSFWTSTSGYVVQCVDTDFSHSGGRPGVCSRHGGYYRTLYSH